MFVCSFWDPFDGYPRMVQAGKPPRLVHWGNYEKERTKLLDLQTRAVKDFEFFSHHLVRLLSNREMLLKEQTLR